MLEKEVRERLMRLENCNVVWSESSEYFAKSFPGLVQLVSDKTATFLRWNLLNVCLVHAVSLKVTKKQIWYIVAHRCTLKGLLFVESNRAEKEAEKCEAEERYRCTGLALQKWCSWRAHFSIRHPEKKKKLDWDYLAKQRGLVLSRCCNLVREDLMCFCIVESSGSVFQESYRTAVTSLTEKTCLLFEREQSIAIFV